VTCEIRLRINRLFSNKYRDECILELARRDFDPENCELREECLEYLRFMEER